jgi:dihydrodipicolinate synthase/N-acetylneuraminate lyase
MIGPWAGIPVAWDKNFRFDEEVYREDVSRCCRAGVPGVYTAGTTGEFYAMEFDEWKAVTKATVEECRKHDTPVMIGVTSTYTLGAQRRAAYAAELGADAIQTALPFWMEIDNRDVVVFFRAVTEACPGTGLTVYETLRAKKALTVEQHREIYEATGCYLAVKANAGTIGRTPEGCRELSEFVNVWVGEDEWSRLGPHGVNGCASSLVYTNPRFLLQMFELLQQKMWDRLQRSTDIVCRLFNEALTPFVEKGFTDTALDRLAGVSSGFLSMSVRSRGPYTSADEEDVRQLRTWMKAHTPELLDL